MIDTRKEELLDNNIKSTQLSKHIVEFRVYIFVGGEIDWCVRSNLMRWYFSIKSSGSNQRRAHSLSGCVNLDSTPLLLGGTGVYCPPQSHYCSWSWNWVFLLRCGLGWNPIRFTPLKFSSYLLIYYSWNCPLSLGLVSPVQVFKQILGCCHQV